MSQNLFKICISYHRPSYILEGDFFVPVWCGKDAADSITKEGTSLSLQEKAWMEKYCLGDNSGDNISRDNRKYSEVTALYWVWKNYTELNNPQYIGFLQYRRHFLINEHCFAGVQPDENNQIYIERMFDDYQQKIGLTPQNIEKILQEHDGIVACNDTGRTIRFYQENHYSQDIKFYLKVLDIIDRDWPQYSTAAHQYDEGTYHSWSSCFLIKKEWFETYCTFLFDVLKKLDAFCQDDYARLNVEQQRILGYAAETIWGIFWRYLTNQGLHFKHVPLVVCRTPFLTL